MNRRALLAFLSSAASFVAARASGSPGRGRFDVHEWGTFTTMHGSDGSVLEGLHHEEEPLPYFVHSLTPMPRMRGERCGGKGFPCDRRVSRVTTKMETPVIYFHTDRARRVQVKVGFENGLLSQFFPIGDLRGFDAGKRGDADLSKIERTSLTWKLDLLPDGDPRTPAFQKVEKGDPWQFAREVRAAAVLGDRNESERYVFYRGLGRVDLPVSVVAREGGELVVKNGATRELPAAFLLEMTPEGGRALEVGRLAAGASTAVSLARAAREPREKVVEDLRGRVHAALVARGLFDDEARAMVRTWSRTWFAAEGTRLLYVVPADVTDTVLPMTITPAPDALVRVLVGRHEILLPGTEREAELAFRDLASLDARSRAAAETRLARFGRFLEPVARRVAAITRDETARAYAAAAIADAGGG